ncbi:MAG: beta-propeller domain-containing protein [Candidatus Micrarchaeota archaeon]|nr:beta-propeller domain-containing protein [Candidatus Micrarchaeota archaeon]
MGEATPFRQYVGAFALAGVVVLALLVVAILPQSSLPPVPSGGNTTSPGGNATASAGLKSFTSYDEIYAFLKASPGSDYGYGVRGGMMTSDMALKGTIAPTAAPGASGAESGTSQAVSASDYSQTNVQVAGVDEPDFVKNDGKYIYVVKNEYNYGSGYNPFGPTSAGKVKIIDAYPAEQMRQTGEISIDGTVSDIFIHNDKLVVFGSIYVPFFYPQPLADGVRCLGCVMPPYYSQNFAFMRVYDISDKSSPKLVKRIEVKGDYKDARMIGGKVYAVFSDYASYSYPVPLYRVDGNDRQVAPTDIKYFDYPDSSYSYNIFTGVDLNDLSKEESRNVVLMGASQNLFVSQDSMYVTFTTYDYYDPQWKIYNEVFAPYFDDATRKKMADIDSMNISDWRKERLKSEEALYFIQNKVYNPLDLTVDASLRDELTRKIAEKQSQESGQYESKETTEAYKFALDGAFTYGGAARVPGHVLNQFSMDEYNGYFRIATTSGQAWSGENPSSNNVYVIDAGMKVAGKLEGLAQGESIYSARFMGNRAYLVTFKKIDPLFVIDLSNPASPQVLGKLKIPGYSDYLHPYDETHLIGLGKDAAAAEGENRDFAWYQGVKLSLFDVSDVAHPKEVASYEIGDRGTDSYALSDHKAFLFSKEKNLLAIPVLLARIDPLKYPNGVEPSTYGDYVFQGEYVFNVSLEKGFVLRGTVSHADPEGFAKSGEYYWGSGTSVKRALYMDGTLYTVSDTYVKANNLSTLGAISSLQIGNSTNGGYAYPMAGVPMIGG